MERHCRIAPQSTAAPKKTNHEERIETLHIILLAACYLLTPLASAATINVSVTGSDASGNGSASNPYASITRACQSALPGDLVLVATGTYTAQANSTSQTLVTCSGTPNSYITIRSAVQYGAILKSNRRNGIRLEAARYVIIDGFDVTVGTSPHADGDGISINVASTDGSISHHVKVINCKVHNFGGGGIMAFRSDYVTIDYNQVYGNAKVSANANSGISLYQMTNADSGSGYRNLIRQNRCWDNAQINGTITDGNGIIIDDGRHFQKGYSAPAYTGRTRIENNVCHYNGGRGIHIFLTQRVDVLFNTVFKNQSSSINDGELTVNDEQSNDGVDNGWEFSDTDVRFQNNIVYARSGKLAKPNAAGASHGGTYYTFWQSNLYYNSLVVVNPGTPSISGNPLFVDPALSNFRLQAGSPAIDAASGYTTGQDFDANPRPVGSGYDIGAFERQSTAPLAGPNSNG